MSSIIVLGGRPLYGEVKVQGSKNAVLPMIAASILNKGITEIEHCPRIRDVYNMIHILEAIGCVVSWEGDVLVVDAAEIVSARIPYRYVKEMRASIIFLGALLGRMKEASLYLPGGCSIGARPIDLHLRAIRKMNVEIAEKEDEIYCKTNKIIGQKIVLDFPSVGATENIILSAVLAEGVTEIYGCAKEPEIMELCQFLNTLGAEIYGGGKDHIKIVGVKSLHDGKYRLKADRIVAGTYLMAAAAARGDIVLHEVEADTIEAVLNVLKAAGCRIQQYEKSVRIAMDKRVKHIPSIATEPYPGFPTDMQSQLMSVLCLAEGESKITENIFESRFKTAEELKKMGAKIEIIGNSAYIQGVSSLTGCKVCAKDLRGGAALIIAGLAAEAETRIDGCCFIERGYESINEDFRSLGARMEKIL